ncbi:hypothetical protein Landi51_12871 [Colletotrichum acutatum]
MDPGLKWGVIDCLLGEFSESRKAEVAAAALTFGMAPMVLQNIGLNTSETSLLFLRRPLLALLLAVSSPWPRNPDSKIYENIIVSSYQPVNSIELVERSVAQSVKQSESRSQELPIWPRHDGKAMIMVILFLEYALALGAAANVALLAYQLGHWAFFASANNIYDPILFTYCVLLIHLVGILGIYLQFQVQYDQSRPAEKNLFQRWLNDEFQLAAHNTGLRLIERNTMVPLKLFIAWIVSIAPTFQVLMGTVMLSGSLLTAQADTRMCLFRYIASTIISRALVTYEISYLTHKNDNPKSKTNNSRLTDPSGDQVGRSI